MNGTEMNCQLYYMPYKTGMTMEDCIAALKLADDLADEVIANVITPDMTQKEQAEAIYSYLAQNVSYDQRYYSDRVNMPYESQTAVGALRDHTAICKEELIPLHISLHRQRWLCSLPV